MARTYNTTRKTPRIRKAPPAIPYEAQEQIWYLQWVNTHLDTQGNSSKPGYDLIHSIPNEGKRSPWMGKKMVDMGLRTGYPDIAIDYPVGPYHGCRIELKRQGEQRTGNGGVRSEQAKWHMRLRSAGYFVATAYSWIDAQNITLEYLAGTEKPTIEQLFDGGPRLRKPIKDHEGFGR